MTNRLDYTPAALYARVSSDRQDVDLSIAAQLRALRDYANKNGYIVVREYVDEAESGRIADRPEFRKMIDAASKTSAPFQEILVWKFSRLHPQARARRRLQVHASGARASGSSPSPSTPTTPHRQAHGGHHRERGRVLLGESGPRGHEGDEGVRLPRLLGLQLRPLRLQTGSWCRTVPRRDPPWNPTRMRPASSSASSTWARPGKGW